MAPSSNSQFGDTTYTKVFVGGLAWETQKETMKNYFQQFGDILEAVVITDKTTGRSKGYGFVTFREADAAMRACVDAAPVIDGRRANCNLASLGVQRSKPSTPKHGGVGVRSFRITGGYQGGFPSATSFPHYAIQQGIPSYNLYAASAAAGYTPYSPDYAYPTNYYNLYGGAGTQYPVYGNSVAAAFYPYLNFGENGGANYNAANTATTNGGHIPYQYHPHHQQQQLYQYAAVAAAHAAAYNSSAVTGGYYGTPISMAPTPPLQSPVCFAVPQA